MADLYKNTLAAAGTTTLTGMTEHGRAKIQFQGNLRVECDLDDGDWQVLFEGPGPLVVIDYVGTTLRLTNTGTTASMVRAGADA